MVAFPFPKLPELTNDSKNRNFEYFDRFNCQSTSTTNFQIQQNSRE